MRRRTEAFYLIFFISVLESPFFSFIFVLEFLIQSTLTPYHVLCTELDWTVLDEWIGAMSHACDDDENG